MYTCYNTTSPHTIVSLYTHNILETNVLAYIHVMYMLHVYDITTCMHKDMYIRCNFKFKLKMQKHNISTSSKTVITEVCDMHTDYDLRTINFC